MIGDFISKMMEVSLDSIVLTDEMIEKYDDQITNKDINSLYEYVANLYKGASVDVRSKYERKILEHVRIDLNLSKYINPKVTQMSFNNFKPFNGKKQKIIKKPITLIYGPNSIGKSSLINAILYLQYFQKKELYSLDRTRLFGDTLDLGGFRKFVYQHDSSRTITYMVQVDDCRRIMLEEKVNLERIEEMTNSKNSYEKKPYEIDSLIYYMNFDVDKMTIKRMHFLSKILFIQTVEEYNNFFDGDKFSKNALYEYYTEKINESLMYIFTNSVSLDDLNHWTRLRNNVIGQVLQLYIAEWLLNKTNNLPLDSSKREYILNAILNKDNNIFPIEEIVKKVKVYLHNKLIPDNYNKDYIELAMDKKSLKIVYEITKTTRKKIVYIDDVIYFSVLENHVDGRLKDIEESKEKRFKFLKNRNNAIVKYMEYYGVKSSYSLLEKLERISQMKQAQYIGPLRFYPERDFSYKEAENDLDIMPNSQESWTLLQNDFNLMTKINRWLVDESRLKTPYEIKRQKLFAIEKILEQLKINEISKDELIEKLKTVSYTKEEIIFEDKRSNTQVSHRDLGLGISQVLPILIASNRNNNKLVAVEQPELHLHPAIQAELADEFIRSFKKQGNDFIIETHSEHLLLRMMKRMRHTFEGKLKKHDELALTPADICILYVDNDEESTYIRELRLSPKGKLLDHWPNGFFEEGFKERFS